MEKIIDCHLHVLTKKDFEIYKNTACANKYINIRGINIEEMLKPFRFEEFLDMEDMYFLDSVNLNNLEEQLIEVERDLQNFPRILGIKVYLGYQHYYANDKKIVEVARLADKYKIAVTFHCGEIFNEEGNSEFSPFSDAKYMEELVEMFPNVNFIASHMNWPNFDSLFELCNKYKNVYTCFSGCNDGETKEERESQNKKIAEIINFYIRKYPSIKKKIMYGTDFFTSSDQYIDVSSYFDVLKLLNITNREKEDILYNNAVSAYKKIL